MIKEMYLDLTGVNERLIQNTYWCNVDKPAKIAVFFSGYRYPTEAPVFHFLKIYFLSKNWAVLSLDYRYNEDPIFLNLSDSEQTKYLNTEALLMKKKLEEKLNFEQYCFIAKSLGTTILCKIIEGDFIYSKNKKSQFVWLTPADANEEIADIILKGSIPSIYVIGDNDPYYNEHIVSKLKNGSSCLCKIIPGAGHIFDHKENIDLTMQSNFNVIKYLIETINF